MPALAALTESEPAAVYMQRVQKSSRRAIASSTAAHRLRGRVLSKDQAGGTSADVPSASPASFATDFCATYLNTVAAPLSTRVRGLVGADMSKEQAGRASADVPSASLVPVDIGRDAAESAATDLGDAPYVEFIGTLEENPVGQRDKRGIFSMPNLLCQSSYLPTSTVVPFAPVTTLKLHHWGRRLPIPPLDALPLRPHPPQPVARRGTKRMLDTDVVQLSPPSRMDKYMSQDGELLVPSGRWSPQEERGTIFVDRTGAIFMYRSFQSQLLASRADEIEHAHNVLAGNDLDCPDLAASNRNNPRGPHLPIIIGHHRQSAVRHQPKLDLCEHQLDLQPWLEEYDDEKQPRFELN
ncbi:hypothetical protein MVEN_01707500 [Mycena venus]|uniref:Uncharacterized protein n=1 Tax=Mycena venus TaxID=2733690 RepID=A0A8H7CQ53_9AGAR|nr:hypothetical protein MVEN_01707500 [Mycena venus]